MSIETKTRNRSTWAWEPFRIWTLQELMGVENFSWIIGHVRDMAYTLERFKQHDPALRVRIPRDNLRVFQDIANFAAENGLLATQSAAEGVLRACEAESRGQFVTQLDLLLQSFYIETSSACFVFIEAHRAADYKDRLLRGGLPHCLQFQCSEDYEEAALCYTMSRDTACVFHCCRVIEALLTNIVWPSLGSPELSNPTRATWGTYLCAIKSAIDTSRRKSADVPAWDGERLLFYDQLVSHFDKVKEAERVKAVHRNEQCSKRLARSMLIHTAALMEHAASHLDNEGQYKE